VNVTRFKAALVAKRWFRIRTRCDVLLDLWWHCGQSTWRCRFELANTFNVSETLSPLIATFAAVFELPGGLGGWIPPNCFLNPPNILSNYVLGGQLYTVYIQFWWKFWSDSDRRKVQPPSQFFTIQTLVYWVMYYRYMLIDIPCIGGIFCYMHAAQNCI